MGIFAECQQALQTFLLAKQSDFPRFCFVSNDSLLTILSIGDDPELMQPHISKIFDGLQTLELSSSTVAAGTNVAGSVYGNAALETAAVAAAEGGATVAGAKSKIKLAFSMIGTGGEVVRFTGGRSLRCGGPVEHWLSQLELNMQSELKARIENALSSAQGFEFKPRPAWVLEHGSQVVAVASQIQFAADLGNVIEAATTGAFSGNQVNQHRLVDFLNEQQRLLRELIMLVQSELQLGDRLKVMTMVTLDVHGRDVIQRFIDDKALLARGTDSFLWQSQLRPMWDGTKVRVPTTPLRKKMLDSAAAKNVAELISSSGDGGGDSASSSSSSAHMTKVESVGTEVQCYDATFPYAHEYLGNISRLVITPLTDRCYLTLTQAVRRCLGGAPMGPAGTGKTETTKDLAHALGRAVWVFNCSDQMDHKTLGRIFRGLSLTGSWGCFDEFNRISSAVLSIVSTQFRAVTDAMRKQGDVSSVHFLSKASIVGTQFYLDGGVTYMHRNKCGVFVTMNPVSDKYAGRTELPETLKTLFRSVTMIRPDLTQITENLLLSQGFVKAGHLAAQLVTMTSMSQKLLSIQVHYDWSLRTIKSMIHIAGDLRRTKTRLSEDLVLYSSINTLMTPKLVASSGDKMVFKSIMKRLYPQFAATKKQRDDNDANGRESSSSSSSSESDSDSDGGDTEGDGSTTTSNKTQTVGAVKEKYTAVVSGLGNTSVKELRDLVAQSAQATGLEANTQFIQQVVDARELMRVRHSLFVLGAEAIGKTELWRTLAHLNSRMGNSTIYARISPKTLDLTELFGRINHKTKEWQDGVYTRVMRAHASSDLKNSAERWIVLDGDVDPDWVESLNSVMDDNKMLTLSNNERILLRPNMRLILETINLVHASPATVSRAGVIFLSDVDASSWEPSASVWIKKRLAKQYGKRFQSISLMIMSYLRAACAQIDSSDGCLRKKYQVVPSCAYGLARSCLKLFDALLQSNEIVISADREREYRNRQSVASRLVGHINEDESSFQKLELLFSFALIWSFGAVLKHQHRWRFNSWLRAFWSQEHGLRECTVSQVAVAKNGTIVAVKSVYPETESVFDWLPMLVGSEDHDALQRESSSSGTSITAGMSRGVGGGGAPQGGRASGYTAAGASRAKQSAKKSSDSSNQQDGGAQVVFHPWSVLIPKNAVLPISLPLKMQHDGTIEGVFQAARLPPPSLSSVLVPCTTSQRILYFLKSRAKANDNVCCVGPSGCGKTVTIRNFLDWQEMRNSLNLASRATAAVPKTIALSHASTAHSLQTFIDDSLEKKAGKTYAPPGRQSIVCFVDDLNLPQVDTYGTQTAIALLQHHLDTGQMYDRAKLLERQVTGIRYIACMDPSVGAGVDYRPNTARLLRHFSVHAVSAPPEDEIHAIYTQVLSSHLLECYFYGAAAADGVNSAGGDLAASARTTGSYAMFESGARGVGARLVQATLSLHNTVKNRFVPTAAHFYFGFSMAHIASTVQGLLQTTPRLAADPRGLARLWLHETCRVYMDCLSTASQRTDFQRLQRQALRSEMCVSVGYGAASEKGSSSVHGGVTIHGGGGSGALEGDDVLTAWSKIDTQEAQQALQKPEMLFGRASGTKSSDYGEFEYGFEGATEILMKIQNDASPDNTHARGLVLFHEAVSDVMKIARLLQMTQAHTLLVGVGGSGKRSLSRLASHLANVRLSELSGDDSGDTTEFIEKMKSLSVEAGVKGTVVALMLTEDQLSSPVVLQVINAMFSIGGLGGIFSDSEREHACQSVKAAVRRSGEMDTTDNCWTYFNRAVTQNLHIVMTVSPTSTVFRKQFVLYPALLRATTIINVLPWQLDALMSVASAFIGERLEESDMVLPIQTWENEVIDEVVSEYKEGLVNSGVNEVAQLEYKMVDLLKLERMTMHAGSAGGGGGGGDMDGMGSMSISVESTRPPNATAAVPLLQSVVDFLVGTHNNASRLAESLVRDRVCFVYVTPALFLRSISEFIAHLRRKRRRIRSDFRRLALGRFKLIATTERVERMQSTLKFASDEVSSAMKTAERQREKLGEESAKVDDEAKTAAVEEVECEAIRVEIHALKIEAEADLAVALPILQKAEAALQSLDKHSLVELKTFKSPHRDVLTVMMAVLTLLSAIPGTGVKLRMADVKKGPSTLETIMYGDFQSGPMGWYAVQRCMRDVGHFLTTLKTYADAINRGTLSNPAVIFAAVDEYLAMPNIDRATIERRSHAAAGICEWVINIRKYYDVYREVDPKRKRLRVEETRLAKSEMRLSNARLHLRKVKEQLLLLTTAFTNATAKKNEALQKFQELSLKLALAERLHSVLASEKSRWEREIEKLSSESRCFVGDALMSVAFSTYSGGFDSASRTFHFMQEQCVGSALELKLRISDAARDHISSIATDLQVRVDWSSLASLPEDNNSQDNATLLNLATHTPLIIDPHQQASNFLVKLYEAAGVDLHTVTAGYGSSGSSGSGSGNETAGRKNTNLGEDAAAGWRAILRNAVVLGESVLIENVSERLHPEITQLLDVVSSGDAILEQNGGRLPFVQHGGSSSGSDCSGGNRGNGNGGKSGEDKNMKKAEYGAKPSPAHAVLIGGRTVRVHSDFRLYLSTRSARPNFSPTLQTKTTLVDFTVAEGALEEQLLGMTVALELPELEHRKQSLRLSLSKLRAQLGGLEDNLLDALSSSSGDLLSNKALVEALEHTKSTALDVTEQVRKTKEANAETDAARNVYIPIAERGVLIFTLWEALRQVDPLYQLSLDSFQRVYRLAIQQTEAHRESGALGACLGRTIISGFDVIGASKSTFLVGSAMTVTTPPRGGGGNGGGGGGQGSSDDERDALARRVAALLESVTLSCFRGAARRLYERHKTGYLFVLALRLLLTYVPEAMPHDVLDFILGDSFLGGGAFAGQRSPLEWLPTDEWISVLALSEIEDFAIDFGGNDFGGPGGSLPGSCGSSDCSFKSLPQHIMSHPARWKKWFSSSHPESDALPGEWRQASIIHHFLLIRGLRKDRLGPMIHRLRNEKTLHLGIDERYVQALSAPFDVSALLNDATLPEDSSVRTTAKAGAAGELVMSWSGPPVRRAPMIFIVCPGTDPTDQIRDAARATKNTLQIMALGQGQFLKASEMLHSAFRSGGWVLLQNIHLVPDNLKALTGLVESLNAADVPLTRPPNAEFCLFMTAEPVLASLPAAPIELIRMAITTTLEPPSSFVRHLKGALATFHREDWLSCTMRATGYQRAL